MLNCISIFQYVQDFIQQAEALMAEQEEETTVDSLIPYIPGVCFIRIMKDLDSQVLEGKFFNKLMHVHVSFICPP